jgi:menaquinone-9 beta-reductase
MSIQLFDAVVIGAGPAGCAAARALALKDWNVLVIDKEMPGRDRVCGGFLGPEVQALWPRLRLSEEFEAFSKNKITRVLVTAANGAFLETELPGAGGFAIDRGAFDSWFCEEALRAGATLNAGTCLVGSKRSRGLWSLLLRHDDKPRQVMARELIWTAGRRSNAILPGRFGGGYFACKSVYEDMAGPADAVSLHFVKRGHVGVNPFIESKATLCLYVDGRYLKDAKGDLDLMMKNLCEENDELAKWMRCARRTAEWKSCRAEPDHRQVFFKDNTFHAGDAVTMINPIIGGGIPVAIEGGLLLAECLIANRLKGRSSVEIASTYRRLWNKRFLSRLRFGGTLGRIERSPAMTRLLFRTLSSIPSLYSSLVARSRPCLTN